MRTQRWAGVRCASWGVVVVGLCLVLLAAVVSSSSDAQAQESTGEQAGAAEIERLEAVIGDLERQLEELRARGDDALADQIAVLDVTVRSMRAQVDALRAGRAVSRESFDELLGRVDIIELAVIDLQQKVQDLYAQGGVGGGGGGVDADVAARVDELESSVESLREELEYLRADTEEILDSIFVELARRATLSGFTTLGLVVPEPIEYPERDYPFFHSFGLNLFINTQITDKLRFFIELATLDVSRFGQGEEGGGIDVLQSFMEFKIVDYFGLRFGIFAVPFGRYNRLHEDWRYPFNFRPLVNELVFPSVYADIGAEFFGIIYRGDVLQLVYDLAVVNGLDDNIGVASNFGSGSAFGTPEFAGQAGDPHLQPGLRGSRTGGNFDNNANKAIVGRIGMIVGSYLNLGVSGYAGRYDDDSIDTDAVDPDDDFWMFMVGGDYEFTWEGLIIRGETAWVTIDEYPEFVVVDLDQDPETVTDRAPFNYPDELFGVNLDIEYRFWFDALNDTFLGAFEGPQFFAAVRYDYVRHTQRDFFENVPRDFEEMQFAVSAGYRPYHRSAIRLEFVQGGTEWAGNEDYGALNLGESWLFAFSVSLGF